MEPERWREIERVYHLAREQAAGRRSAFLEQACGGDEELRREVESLLSHADGAQEYLETVVLEAAAQARDQPSAPAAMIGQTVSHYRVVEKLGGGGMGVVYRAEDLRLRREVALKLLTDNLAGEPLAVERFEREARAAAAINHPNICTVYEVGEDGGRPFLAMELLEGTTLRECIGRQPVPLDVLLDWAAQIAGGLAAAHARDIIHRDIKPANLFVTTAGQAKILDFGLAKLARTRPGAPPESLTGPDLALGTAAYMSPEQARGEQLDARTDLFSFGAVVYEMATGQRAFDGNTTAVIFDAILNRAVKLNADVPPKLAGIIHEALEKDRRRRYQTAAEMQADLKAVRLRGARPRRAVSALLPTPLLRLLAALLFLLVAAAAIWFYLHRQSRHLTDRDTIVLADFTNTTGDPIFDGTLRQGLAAQLEQSPFLNLLSDSRIAQTLGLMTEPKDARLTQKLARDVCQRTASAATIEGSIASQGGEYVLGLRAVNCRSGDLLAQEHVTANGKESVLRALGEAATKMRRKLGESLASVQKYDVPLYEVTSGSLEALQAYTLSARAQSMRYDNVAAIPQLQRAVSIDPNFATAFAFLAACYDNLGEIERAAENARRAYELRARVSERERFFITTVYEIHATGNLEAARRELEQWAQTYPNDIGRPTNARVVYNRLGDFQNALVAAQEAEKLSPGRGIAYLALAGDYMKLNRLDEARAMAGEARKLGAAGVGGFLYGVDFLQHDAAAMERDVAELMSKPESEHIALNFESDTASYFGKFDRARDLTRRTVASAQRTGDPEDAASFLAGFAWNDAYAGNLGLARRQARAALALSHGKEVEAIAAIALALAGDAREGRQLAGDLAKRFPEDTVIQKEYLPMIHACTELGAGGASSAAKAIEALRVAAPYELAQIDAVYLRGEAYLAVRQGTAAGAEFQKILDHPGVVVDSVTGPLARLGLGRAYVLAGDTARARTAYQDFLALWKDADPDIPVLKQAKAEYARLVKAGLTQTPR